MQRDLPETAAALHRRPVCVFAVHLAILFTLLLCWANN